MEFPAEDVLPPLAPEPTSAWGATPVRDPNQVCQVEIPGRTLDFLATLHHELANYHSIIQTTGKLFSRFQRSLNAIDARAVMHELVVSATEQAVDYFNKSSENMVQVRTHLDRAAISVAGAVISSEFSYNIIHQRYELHMRVSYVHPVKGTHEIVDTVVTPFCRIPDGKPITPFYPAEEIYVPTLVE